MAINMHMTRNQLKPQGFTLIELMITLVIGTILVMLAVPSFKKTISNNLVITQANSLISSINYARSEAVKRHSNVTVCASTDQATCGGTNWRTGWIVRLDSDNSILRSQEALKGNTAITYIVSAGAPVQFNSQGIASINPTFVLTPEGCVTGYLGIYNVTISPTGRASVAKSTIPCL